MERLKAKRKLEAKQEASLAQEYGVDRYSSGRRTQGGYGGNLDEYEQDGFSTFSFLQISLFCGFF